MGDEVRKVHHSYIWLGGFKAFLATLVGVAVGLAGSIPSIVAGIEKSGISFDFDIVVSIAVASILTVILFVGVFVFGFWLSWKCLGYELGTAEFSLYKGIISKKRQHVPYQRVQSVDVRASLLQRIAGVCSVEIDTAGGASNKAIVVPYVTKAAADELRHELFARKRAVLFGAADDTDSARPMPVNDSVAPANVLDELGDAFSDSHGMFDGVPFVDPVASSFEARLTNKELALSGLSDVKSAVGAVVLGLVGILGFVLGFDPVAQALSQWFAGLVGGSAFTGQSVASVSMMIALRLLPALIIAIACGAIVIAALSTVSSMLSYGNFCVRRRGSRIEVERGLLQHQTQGVDVDRVQFVRVEHGWIRRKLGYCKVYFGRIDSVASNDGAGNSSMSAESASGMVVHPFLKTSELPKFLAGILPEVDYFFDKGSVSAPPARAKRRAVVRNALWRSAGFWALIGMAMSSAITLLAVSIAKPQCLDAVRSIALFLWPLLLLCVVDMIVGVARGLRWHAGSSLAYGENLARFTNEGFTCTEVVVPRKKIQFACLRANPFQTMAKVRCAFVTTAAGTGSTRECIYDIDEEEASAFLDWLRPRK